MSMQQTKCLETGLLPLCRIALNRCLSIRLWQYYLLRSSFLDFLSLLFGDFVVSLNIRATSLSLHDLRLFHITLTFDKLLFELKHLLLEFFQLLKESLLDIIRAY